MTTAVATTQGRTLIDEELFDRLCRKITRDKGVDQEFAERVMDQALAFLGAAAAFPGSRLAPSPAVDVGWHCFILHTIDYAAFCHRVAGRFIHHVPEDRPSGPEHSLAPVTVREETLATIRRAGYTVDMELWTGNAHNCSCHEEGNCLATGRKGDENTETHIPPPHQS